MKENKKMEHSTSYTNITHIFQDCVCFVFSERGKHKKQEFFKEF